jgi:hypothetical protein
MTAPEAQTAIAAALERIGRDIEAARRELERLSNLLALIASVARIDN